MMTTKIGTPIALAPALRLLPLSNQRIHYLLQCVALRFLVSALGNTVFPSILNQSVRKLLTSFKGILMINAHHNQPGNAFALVGMFNCRCGYGYMVTLGGTCSRSCSWHHYRLPCNGARHCCLRRSGSASSRSVQALNGQNAFGENGEVMKLLNAPIKIIDANVNAADRERGDLAKAVRVTTGISIEDIKEHGVLGGDNSGLRKICNTVAKVGGGRC